MRPKTGVSETCNGRAEYCCEGFDQGMAAGGSYVRAAQYRCVLSGLRTVVKERWEIVIEDSSSEMRL